MLDMISFVGIDTRTDIKKLKELSDNCEVALEFGVLYSQKRAGKQARYPSLESCRDIYAKLANEGVRSSLHLCGQEAIDGYFSQLPDIMRLVELNEGRVQLNLNVANFELEDLTTKIIETQDNVIIQVNKTKQELVNSIIKYNAMNQTGCDIEKISFLFDGSGGFGKTINKFEPVFQGYYTGYAGGINPENVKQIAELIDEVNDEDDEWYIDMESGIRTNDIFDVYLCEDVIKNLGYF